jgi:spore maturation protein CgeB
MELLLIIFSTIGFMCGISSIALSYCILIKTSLKSDYLNKTIKNNHIKFENQIMNLIHKELQKNSIDLRKLLQEDAADIAHNVLSMDSENKLYKDPYKNASFKRL